MNYPSWCNLDRLPLIPSSAKKIAPHKPNKAAEFADTIGVQVLAHNKGHGFGKSFVFVMLFAATMLACQKPASSNNPPAEPGAFNCEPLKAAVQGR